MTKAYLVFTRVTDFSDGVTSTQVSAVCTSLELAQTRMAALYKTNKDWISFAHDVTFQDEPPMERFMEFLAFYNEEPKRVRIIYSIWIDEKEML